MLPADDAATYADWFACLAEPTRVRLLHAVATAGRSMTVGELTELLGISQSTCSHHVRKLVEVGFLRQHKEGTATHVSVNPSCCTGLPHAADVVMGVLAPRPCCPDRPPGRRPVRAAGGRRLERRAPHLRRRHRHRRRDLRNRSARCAGHSTPSGCPTTAGSPRSTAQVAGWAAATAVSTRDCYAGVAETSVYVAADFRGRGVGKALVHKQVNAADDAGLWTLQTSIFPENRASLALHHSAGFRTLGVRERIAQHHGVWRDTVFLERRTAN